MSHTSSLQQLKLCCINLEMYTECGAAMSPSLLTSGQARVHQLHGTVMLDTTNLVYLVTASTKTTHYEHIQDLKKTLPSCFHPLTRQLLDIPLVSSFHECYILCFTSIINNIHYLLHIHVYNYIYLKNVS